jgi:hypothetical protein
MVRDTVPSNCHYAYAGIDWRELENHNVKPPKPRKYKKGLVNLQPAGVRRKPSVRRCSFFVVTHECALFFCQGRPTEMGEEIDQSLFQQFDTVVKAEEGGHLKGIICIYTYIYIHINIYALNRAGRTHARRLIMRR